MRYLLTYYTDTGAGESRFNANSDTEATTYAKQVLAGKDATNISLWRRGDFVILGRESTGEGNA